MPRGSSSSVRLLTLLQLLPLGDTYTFRSPYQRLQRVERRGVITTRQQRLQQTRLTPTAGPSAAKARASSYEEPRLQGQQTLFRHRFVVHSDFCIRMPLDAQSLLYSCVMHPALSGYIELQLEAFRPFVKMQWSPDSQRMLSLPNAGGSSLTSEALAFELLARTFGASLQRTELELHYRRGSKMTDFAIEIFGGYQLGVSVTRAYKWHGLSRKRRAELRRTQQEHQDPSGPERPEVPDGPLAVEPPSLTPSRPPPGGKIPGGLEPHEARRLLIKKLAAIKESSSNVQNFSWRKQLLVVFTFCHADVTLLEAEYAKLPVALRTNTVLLVTRTNGVQWIW